MIETPNLGDQSLVYMYGISDFWTDMFGDTQLVETLLSAETVQLAEAYSYFLQRAAGISLTDIQEKYQTRIKLLLLSQEDLVDPSDLSTFNIDSSVVDLPKISNRPILPTSTLSYGIHYDISNRVIKFHKPVDELKFPIRYKSDGTWQYALWMTDVEINDKWIDNTFGRLVGFTEEDAIFNYKSFLEGVYFLYTNGPNISNIVRGVNLAMGMPYARETEAVLDVIQDETSSNWVVFTSTYAYEIPYSYQPEVVSGDILIEGQIISTWVEVLDYSTSGAWWYQIYLPREVLSKGADPYSVGIASEGSTGDSMMDNFLKHHMFEVLITQPSNDITTYNTARNLILRAKPEYTYPVFVWKATVTDEYINSKDDLTYKYKADRTDTCLAPPSVRFMDRSVENDGFTRGISWYNRYQSSMYTATLLGFGDWKGNGGWAPQFSTISDRYMNVLGATTRNRGDFISHSNRNTIMRGTRGKQAFSHSGLVWNIPATNVVGGDQSFSINEKDLTPLYMMSSTELLNKVRTVNPRFTIGNRNTLVVTGINLVSSYDTWMIRNDSITDNDTGDFKFEYSEGDLDIAFSIFAYQTYVPKLENMYNSEGNPITDGTLMITRSKGDTWVCQWLRTDSVVAPTIFPVEDPDLTTATEVYRFDKLGDSTYVTGRSISAEVVRERVNGIAALPSDVLVIVDGKCITTEEYSVETLGSMAEIKVYEPTDPWYTELNNIDSSYVILDSAPEDSGYVIYDESSDFEVNEEIFPYTSSNTYTLTNSVVSKDKLLVIIDGLFNFSYSVSDNLLSVNSGGSDVVVRYVKHTSSVTLPKGSTEYNLRTTSYCKLFIENKLVEDWKYKRDGEFIMFPEPTSNNVLVRYIDRSPDVITSAFNRSTVKDNNARFLMDRSRENGEYDDHLGNVSYMNRSGVPTTESYDPVDKINVIRRLI